jgi:hypothetical protein
MLTQWAPRDRSSDSPDVHRLRPRRAERFGGRRRRGPRRQDVVDEQHTGGGGADRIERTTHRRAALRSRSRRLRRRRDGSAEQASGRRIHVTRHRHCERPRLIEAAIRAPLARQGHPRDHVHLWRRCGRDRGCQRARDVAPARELQPVDRPLGCPRIGERGPRRRDRIRRTLPTGGNPEHRRHAASFAPRRVERLEIGHARRTERPRATAAAGASPRERRIDEPTPHGPTLRVGADTPRARRPRPAGRHRG